MTDKEQKGFAADRIDRAEKGVDEVGSLAGRKVYYRLDDLVEWMRTRGGDGR